MYVIVDYKDVIIAMSKTVDYQSNGNPILDNNTAIAKILVKKVYEIEEIPEGVKENKYCYTEEKGFYINENYKEPVDEMAEISEIQLAIAELYEIIEGGK